MDVSLSQDSLSSLIPLSDVSLPATPDPPHAQLPSSDKQVDGANNHMTPPPSTQIPSSQRARTPTPTVSHISTPPPTNEMPSQPSRAFGRLGSILSQDQIRNATVDELRSMVGDLQAALQEAKMTAAHHKLQYQMLAQESAAALERVNVEVEMDKFESEIIRASAQAKVQKRPVPPPMPQPQDGMILVQKDLYQRMCREIQELNQERAFMIDEHAQKDRMLTRQDNEIATLSDRLTLMRDRIRENREHLNKHRRATPFLDGTPRSVYNDPLRTGVSSLEQPQPFAALLQASEMASQEARRPMAKKGHARNTHSMSSLPTTPQRSSQKHQMMFQTPSGRQPPFKVPSTAPVQRTSAMRTPDVYAQHALPVTKPPGPPSDGTVSAPEDEDSEAETDIIAQDNYNAISESQASRAASQMLRSSQEQQAKRDSFKGSGMLPVSGEKKQTKLFGDVRKANVDRGGEPPAKRARTDAAVGLGIAGVRQ